MSFFCLYINAIFWIIFIRHVSECEFATFIILTSHVFASLEKIAKVWGEPDPLEDFLNLWYLLFVFDGLSFLLVFFLSSSDLLECLLLVLVGSSSLCLLIVLIRLAWMSYSCPCQNRHNVSMLSSPDYLSFVFSLSLSDLAECLLLVLVGPSSPCLRRNVFSLSSLWGPSPR